VTPSAAPAVAVNVADKPLDGIVTVAGTATTPGLSLSSVTTVSLELGSLSVTVIVADPATDRLTVAGVKLSDGGVVTVMLVQSSAEITAPLLTTTHMT
jgi:hypothetical protein